MALSRRTGARFQANIWPGFVDAMTGLLLVLMFVLTIFMVVQFVLRETITGQESEMTQLNQEIAKLAQALGLEQRKSTDLEARVGALGATLDSAESRLGEQATLIASLTATSDAQAKALSAADAKITTFEAQVASLLAERDNALAGVASLEKTRDALLSEKEALNMALAQARSEVDAGAEQARRAAAEREALEALIAQAEADAQANAEKAQANAEEIATLKTELSKEEAARLVEIAAAEALRKRLEGATTELTAMTLSLEEERKKAEETLTLLAAAQAAEAKLSAALEGKLSEAGKRAALLATANAALEKEEALSAAAQREQELLNQQVAALREQLGGLQAIIDDYKERDAAADIQLSNLGQDLNAALARAAAEERKRRELEEAERIRLEAEKQDLERYRSEFFGRLRDVMGAQEGVRIVGDRFVFSSEVLFAQGQANLSRLGQRELAKIADILRNIASDIPSEIDWVIRVDGHTDTVPLSGAGEFADNWELSQARALSVVRYMVNFLGIPPERLSANGFGQYQPIATGNSNEARAQNRRIELKFTEK